MEIFKFNLLKLAREHSQNLEFASTEEAASKSSVSYQQAITLLMGSIARRSGTEAGGSLVTNSGVYCYSCGKPGHKRNDGHY